MVATSSDSSQSAWDVTGDGVFTITDVGVWLNAVFFRPGNEVLATLMETSLGRFFEMTPEWYGGWFSGMVSAGFWLVVLWIIAYVFALVQWIIANVFALFFTVLNFLNFINDWLKEKFGRGLHGAVHIAAFFLIIGIVAIAIVPTHLRTFVGLSLAIGFAAMAAIWAAIWAVVWLISRLVARYSTIRSEKFGNASRNDRS